MWLEDDGVHALVPGTRPSKSLLAEMTRRFQDKIHHSPVWDQMVQEFGEEKAEQLLRQCKAETQ
jgi:hypothetical protein